MKLLDDSEIFEIFDYLINIWIWEINERPSSFCLDCIEGPDPIILLAESLYKGRIQIPCVQEVVTHFVYVTYYIKWVTTSWTYSTVTHISKKNDKLVRNDTDMGFFRGSGPYSVFSWRSDSNFLEGWIRVKYTRGLATPCFELWYYRSAGAGHPGREEGGDTQEARGLGIRMLGFIFYIYNLSRSRFDRIIKTRKICNVHLKWIESLGSLSYRHIYLLWNFWEKVTFIVSVKSNVSGVDTLASAFTVLYVQEGMTHFI